MNVENIESLARKPLLVLFCYILLSVGGGLGMVLTHGMPQPTIHDEFSYLLMADTFAHGRLVNEAHPQAASFHTFHVIHDKVYASKYFPGIGAQLLFGRLIGAPILGVWLTMALWATALWWLLITWFPARWSFFGGVLLLMQVGWCSYFGHSYWGGGLFGLGGTLVLAGLVGLRRTPAWLSGIGLGTGILITLLTRPFEGFFFCAAAGIWLLGALWKNRTEIAWGKWLLRGIVPAVSGLVLGLVLLGVYNAAVTGKPTKFPHRLYDETYFNNIQRFPWQDPKTEPPKVAELPAPMAMMRESYNGYAEGVAKHFWELKWDAIATWFEFYVPVWWAPFVVIGLVFGFYSRSGWSWLALLLIAARLPPLLLSLSSRHPHYSAPWGDLVLILAVGGLWGLEQWMRGERWKKFTVVPSLVLLAVGSGVYAVNLNPAHISQWKAQTSYAANWMTFRQLIEWHLRERVGGEHLVLVRYGPKHVHHAEWVYNSADIDDQDIVWAHFLDDERNASLIHAFPDYRVWIVLENGMNQPPKLYDFDELKEGEGRDLMPGLINE